ncbi:ribonuclease S-5-like [Nicotiana tomentosiformis]|uniref:ribonuclease S-5-like n=1 Tax=Nicotiana tomentosiformis TaxID=4098 RepID=UPI00388CCF77
MAPTLCEMQLQSRKTPCKSGNPEQLFIHGLWPCDMRARSLTCLCVSPSLEDQNVKNVLKNDNNLEAALHNVWPNLVAGRQDKTFWKYQWRTHGLCSSPTVQATDYFNAAATVHATLIAKTPNKNLINYFVAAGINPDGHTFYSLHAITAAVRTVVGSNNHVYASCKSNGTQNLLHECL